MGNCIAVCGKVQKPVLPTVQINNQDDLINKQLEEDVIVPQKICLENSANQITKQSAGNQNSDLVNPGQFQESVDISSIAIQNKENERKIENRDTKTQGVKQSERSPLSQLTNQNQDNKKAKKQIVCKQTVSQKQNSKSNTPTLKGRTQKDNQLIKKTFGNQIVDIQKVQLQNGVIYQGQWINGYRQGKGTQLWVDGSRYVGEWKNNQANGYGVLHHSDGDVYQGQWVNDKANGTGTYTHSNGAKYFGEWKDDKQCGRGVQQWLDGARYEGQYSDGAKNGKGILKFLDGSYYQGEFSNNQIHGYGIYIWAQNRRYQGYWAHNKMNGKGKIQWNDGRKYQGDYVNDKKHGFGSFEWADGRRYIGYWQDGKQHGRGEYIGPKGDKRTGQWQDGKRIRWLDEMPVK